MTTAKPNLSAFRSSPMAFFESLTAHGAARFGDAMADFQRHRFASLVESLLSVAADQKPLIGRHWWEGTKGSSKDSDLAAVVCWLLAFTSRPLRIQIGAADRDQAAEMHKAAAVLLHENPWLSARIVINNYKLICEKTKSEAEIIPADVAGSHGARPDVLILNELSHITRWEFAENLADNATKVPLGLVIIATNAGFRNHPAWKWREMARTSKRWSFHQFAGRRRGYRSKTLKRLAGGILLVVLLDCGRGFGRAETAMRWTRPILRTRLIGIIFPPSGTSGALGTRPDSTWELKTIIRR